MKHKSGIVFTAIFRFFSNYIGIGQGFKLKYQILHGAPQVTYRIGACGGSFTTPKGILTSPSYPRNYPNDADCIYTISPPDGAYISVSFLSMDIDCQGTPPDYIELRDGDSEDSPLMGSFCGDRSNVPAVMQTTQNHLRIRREGRELLKNYSFMKIY